MSLHDYLTSQQRAFDAPFYGLIMAAMRRADTANLVLLKNSWPEVWAELEARYNAPGGALPGDAEYDAIQETVQRLLGADPTATI